MHPSFAKNVRQAKRIGRFSPTCRKHCSILFFDVQFPRRTVLIDLTQGSPSFALKGEPTSPSADERSKRKRGGSFHIWWICWSSKGGV